MTVEEMVEMDRLDEGNDETTRNKILTERRNAQLAVYGDVVRALEQDDGEEIRRNRHIETFDDFVTYLNGRMEDCERRGNRNDETTLMRARIEELERENEESQTTITAISCLLYTSPSPRDLSTSRMPSSA